MLPILKSIALHMKARFTETRDEIGVNLSAVKILQKEIQDTLRGEQELDLSRPAGGEAFMFWLEY